MASSSWSCKACDSHGSVCDLSLPKKDFTLDLRCNACVGAGTDCGIPTDDKKLLENGIDTASPSTQPSRLFGLFSKSRNDRQRKCLNCATDNTNCKFPGGYRPNRCTQCFIEGASTCMIPASAPSSVPRDEPLGKSLVEPLDEPLDDLVNVMAESVDPTDNMCSPMSVRQQLEDDLNAYSGKDLEQYQLDGISPIDNVLSKELLLKKKKRHTHSPEPEPWTQWMDIEIDKAIAKRR
ncbi:hypothetical protein F4821DRAFT_260809 [Hypoxylon rubiginosum]|uniref:Uncharacterized protein n=1 Tax=Hypoxylon rubiginosum TaxID=110542 RepID=A0ACC0CZ17_9PEZI|nr:hypothetical protein F4821DRAFT_260809 [Hypoxylon rubiginosum]